MKKIFYILASAIVALGAVACENEALDNVNPDNNVKGEGLTITATIDEATKVAFEGLTPSWEEGDKLVIGEYEFTFTEGNNFTCEKEGVYSLCDGQKKEINAGTFDSSNGINGSAWWALSVIEREGTVVELQLVTALLKVTAAADNTVLKSTMFSNEGEDVALTKGVETYVPIWQGDGTTVTYFVDGIECKSLTKNFEAGKIYNLGTLEVAESGYNVVGSFQGWDTSEAGAVKMYQYKDWAIAQGVELYKSDEFKIVKGNTWDESYGFESPWVMEDNVEVTLDGTENIQVCKNGKFDIYFNGETKMAKYVCVDEYTDLEVDITINNDANWENYTITLKEGDTVIVDKAAVTGNKYAVSGEYIGKTLDYTLTSSDGTKNVSGKVTISKEGANVNLIEAVIKFTFKLDTDNAKQWWGTTAKIHIWNADASIATSWPGVEMIYDGEYTWHYDIPASLAGQTMKYLIHNGNGWQSNEPTITIDANGITVTGSSIGIN